MTHDTTRRALLLLLVLALSFQISAAGLRGESRSELEPATDRLTAPAHLPMPPTDDDFYPRDPAKEELGRLLFFDKILSGNLNISCATCHHPLAGTSDALSLPVGEGGQGTGTVRNTGSVFERVPRNSPHVFNLGAKEFVKMFHDGRVQVDPTEPSGFDTPAGYLFPEGLDNVLAAQAMFPVTSMTEMAGQFGENDVGDAADQGDLQGVWELLAERLRNIPEYYDLFVEAFDDIELDDDITFVHAANAIAAFEAAAWRFDDSPFDRFLRGDQHALSKNAREGMKLFYGKAGCSSCHTGAFQTDQHFYAIGVPQIGPGKGDQLPGTEGYYDDFGRERVTGLEADRFRFRVPTLRNVAVSGPWGHDGAYNDLESMVRHVLDPATALEEYDTSQCLLPPDEDLDPIDFLCHDDLARRAAIAAAIEIAPVELSDAEVGELVDFLNALTDPRVFDLRSIVPMEVPSGIAVAD